MGLRRHCVAAASAPKVRMTAGQLWRGNLPRQVQAPAALRIFCSDARPWFRQFKLWATAYPTFSKSVRASGAEPTIRFLRVFVG